MDYSGLAWVYYRQLLDPYEADSGAIFLLIVTLGDVSSAMGNIFKYLLFSQSTDVDTFYEYFAPWIVIFCPLSVAIFDANRQYLELRNQHRFARLVFSVNGNRFRWSYFCWNWKCKFEDERNQSKGSWVIVERVVKICYLQKYKAY